MPVRILLLADSHLGFDLPLTRRVERRRRGIDFLANFRQALAPGLAGEVDLVVHGGDVFHRARPHHTLVAQAVRPLIEIAERGVPVFVVPGNHERSRIPHARFASHPNLHIFDRPRTFHTEVRGRRVVLFGFPYERGVVRLRFPELVKETGWRPGQGDVSLLCVHHCFEGATVGPSNFTFRRGPDVIRCRDIPPGVTAVLTGHVHRHQVLTTDLDGRPLAAAVFYPGSTDRTAFAEKDEAKGYMVLDIDAGRTEAVRSRFHELATRPMVVKRLDAAGLDRTAIRTRIHEAVSEAPADAVLRIHVHGDVPSNARDALAAASVRALAPASMNVEVLMADGGRPWRRAHPNASTRRAPRA